MPLNRPSGERKGEGIGVTGSWEMRPGKGKLGGRRTGFTILQRSRKAKNGDRALSLVGGKRENPRVKLEEKANKSKTKKTSPVRGERKMGVPSGKSRVRNGDKGGELQKRAKKDADVDLPRRKKKSGFSGFVILGGNGGEILEITRALKARKVVAEGVREQRKEYESISKKGNGRWGAFLW